MDYSLAVKRGKLMLYLNKKTNPELVRVINPPVTNGLMALVCGESSGISWYAYYDDLLEITPLLGVLT